MELGKSYYNGKELYYNYLCGHRCYVHKSFVKSYLAQRRDNDEYVGEFYTSYRVKFPVVGCDLLKVDNNLVIVPGDYNLFVFSCDKGGCEIKEIENAIKLFKSPGNNCALILSNQDSVKIKWNNWGDQWITVIYKNGIKEQIASEELLKYL